MPERDGGVRCIKAAHPFFKIRREKTLLSNNGNGTPSNHCTVGIYGSAEPGVEILRPYFHQRPYRLGENLCDRRNSKGYPPFISLWEQDALLRAASDSTRIIVLDDFQAIYDIRTGTPLYWPCCALCRWIPDACCSPVRIFRKLFCRLLQSGRWHICPTPFWL